MAEPAVNTEAFGSAPCASSRRAMSIRPVLTASSSGPPDENVWSSSWPSCIRSFGSRPMFEQSTQHVRTIAPHCRLQHRLSLQRVEWA